MTSIIHNYKYIPTAEGAVNYPSAEMGGEKRRQKEQRKYRSESLMFQAGFPPKEEWSLKFVYSKGCLTIRVIGFWWLKRKSIRQPHKVICNCVCIYQLIFHEAESSIWSLLVDISISCSAHKARIQHFWRIFFFTWSRLFSWGGKNSSGLLLHCAANTVWLVMINC